MIDVLTSEFVWGIVIGLSLAIVVAGATILLDNRRHRRRVAAFCQDAIGSICELIQNLEDNRNRNRVIDQEFLEVIAAEITVYGRNRELLVLLEDQQLRKDIREFFTRVAALVTQVQTSLRLFAQAIDIAGITGTTTDASTKASAEASATGHLQNAHNVCDRLRDLMSRQQKLDDRLAPLAKVRWWLF